MSVSKILLIEDNPADVLLLRHAFDEVGEPYVLEILPDGEAALAFVAEHRSGVRQHDPCVILLDLHLPKFNGIEVLTAVRQDPALDHIHVVVLTSFASSQEQLAVTALGGICRMKPAGLPDIKKMACELLDLCKGRSTGIVSAGK